ncbi:MAG: putative dithiol-disulfide oxidoreductase (DUF899 family) [Oceanicoccus sp.]|jgi:predicted dithiol-disulfide oxidoreductase (DUF899 family)
MSPSKKCLIIGLFNDRIVGEPVTRSIEVNSFNKDFHVSFTQAEIEHGEIFYNYTNSKNPREELPAISVFYKDTNGEIFHSYSCYARGLDMLNGAYHFMDIVTKRSRSSQSGLWYVLAKASRTVRRRIANFVTD